MKFFLVSCDNRTCMELVKWAYLQNTDKILQTQIRELKMKTNLTTCLIATLALLSLSSRAITEDPPPGQGNMKIVFESKYKAWRE